MGDLDQTSPSMTQFVLAFGKGYYSIYPNVISGVHVDNHLTVTIDIEGGINAGFEIPEFHFISPSRDCDTVTLNDAVASVNR
jgi:hypothetical protein